MALGPTYMIRVLAALVVRFEAILNPVVEVDDDSGKGTEVRLRLHPHSPLRSDTPSSPRLLSVLYAQGSSNAPRITVGGTRCARYRGYGSRCVKIAPDIVTVLAFQYTSRQYEADV
jgi:hypothetical protein